MANNPPIPRKRQSSISHTSDVATAQFTPSRPPPPIKPQMRSGSNQVMTTEKDIIIKSDSYTLEEFNKHFQLPQIVRVYTGHYGLTEQLSMSEGEEFILFFVKSAKVVKATTRSKSETYYLPLNSSLQFSPYYETDSSAAGSEHYKTVRDLIQGREDLPIAVKVCTTFSGKSEESSVVEGDIIFPKQLSGKGKNKILECADKTGKILKLELNCTGEFSINPCDVRMHLLEYIKHVNKFPVAFQIYSEKEQSKKLFYIQTGTVLVLEAPQPLRSYICSSDIFGENDYPLSELPMIIPIQIQCIERPGINMEPIYHKVQDSYENFIPSMVAKNMTIYPSQSYSELKLQQQFYEEVQKGESNSYYYELERPDAIYEQIPGEYNKQNPSTVVVSNPPLPGRNSCRNLIPLPRRHQSIPSSYPINPVAGPIMPQHSMPLNKSTYPVTTTTPEENIAYLKTMDVETVLQLLGDMNLAEYKDSFQREQVDGELLVVLSKQELEDLGVTKRIHQLRLTQLINGSSSAKKYEGGIYGMLS
ncbi:uncharacterized protein [Dysidea avara]|uniref:uncharacterized protein n=1 Tax=Dysidea avara TaxID=196820 RepID=UPI003322E791